MFKKINNINENELDRIITIEIFDNLSFTTNIKTLEKIISKNNYDSSLIFEYIAWSFYKEIYLISKDRNKVDKLPSYIIPKEFELENIIGKKYIQVSIDSKIINVSVKLLELFLASLRNFTNMKSALQDYYINTSITTNSFLHRNIEKLEKLIPILIGAYQQIYILLQEQDHGLNDQVKIKILKELLESNKLNYNKIINIYERVMENVGDEQAFKELREKQNSFMNNSYELEILKSLYSFLLLSHDNLNIDTSKFLSSYKNKIFNNNFYILFLKVMINYYEFDMYFPDGLIENINNIYYSLELDDYYKTEFNVYFKNGSIIPEQFIYNKINSQIYTYIYSNIPENIASPLEKIIAIYILLGDIFQYNINYALFNDEEELNEIPDIDLVNNEVICWQLSLIYYKLLKKDGYYVELDGVFGFHLNVDIDVDNILISADATSFGEYPDCCEYLLSDMAKVKFGFDITNFRLRKDDYYEKYKHLKLGEIEKIIKKDEQKLDEAITNVYEKLGKKTIKESKFNNLVDRYQKNRERNNIINNSYHTKKDIDYRISTINYFYNMNINATNVEKIQFISKYIYQVFSDFNKDDLELMSIVKVIDDNKMWLKLLIVYDTYKQRYYYLEEENGFHEYNLKSLIDKMAIDNMYFKEHISRRENKAKRTK